MTEQELEKKNKRVTNIKTGLVAILKLITLYSIVCTAFMYTWNYFFHGVLGLGKEVQDWYLFGLPTIGLFAILRCLSPFWFKLVNMPDVLIYSVVYFGFLYFLIM